MTIRLTIDRIVLHDIDLSPIEQARMHDDLYAALTEALGGRVGVPVGRRGAMESLDIPCAERARLGISLGRAMGTHLWRGPAIASPPKGVR